MPNFLDYILGRSPARQRNLQEGLFQIASQTCNLLVQVNNTNNISYGNNSMNIQLNNVNNLQNSPLNHANGNAGLNNSNLCETTTSSDKEQLVVLLPKSSTDKTTKLYKPSGIFGKRLSLKLSNSTIKLNEKSTVLESPPHHNGDDSEIWAHQTYMVPADGDVSPSRRWGQKSKWCRPSCIPISIICILIFLVVLLPLLDHAAEKALEELNSSTNLCNTCRLSLIESIPDGLIYPNNSIKTPSTFDTWLNLINLAEKSIEIASLYWTLRRFEIYPDPTSIKGEEIFQALLKAGTDRGIELKIAQNAPTQSFPNIDTELLTKRKAAEVRSLNFAKLLGGGVLHTKLWLVDRKHVYIGSANMDWRSLTQVKEMGIAIYNCSCLAEDVGKIFDVYWDLGKDDAKIPDHWPDELSTKININTPLNLTYANESFQTFFSSSPPSFNPAGRTNDIDALINVIEHAEQFIYIAVMDYFPLMIYTPKIKYWPIIDDAIKGAAINHNVKIKMLISWWNHSRTSEDNFLRSIADINEAYPRVSIEVRRFIVPANEEQQKIPFARVNHNKYMVTDNTAFIGTSNWSGDYFTDTAGISLILHDPVYDRNVSHITIRSQLQAIFERDWNSNYTYPLGN